MNERTEKILLWYAMSQQIVFTDRRKTQIVCHDIDSITHKSKQYCYGFVKWNTNNNHLNIWAFEYLVWKQVCGIVKRVSSYCVSLRHMLHCFIVAFLNCKLICIHISHIVFVCLVFVQLLYLIFVGGTSERIQR